MSRSLTLPLMFSLSLALPAVAQDVAEVRLVPGWVSESGTRMVAVDIVLEPGWKTYWRAPQGNGIPPDFDTSRSSNLAGAVVHWPRPVVFETLGVRSVGYADRVIFPIELTPVVAEAPIGLELDLFFGVCEEVCIPAERSLALLVDGVIDSPAAGAIRESYDSRTVAAAAAGLESHDCSLAPDGEKQALHSRLRFSGSAPRPEMVVAESGSELIWITVEQVASQGPALTISGAVSYYGDGGFSLDPDALRLSLIGAGPVVEVTGCPPS